MSPGVPFDGVKCWCRTEHTKTWATRFRLNKEKSWMFARWSAEATKLFSTVWIMKMDWYYRQFLSSGELLEEYSYNGCKEFMNYPEEFKLLAAGSMSRAIQAEAQRLVKYVPRTHQPTTFSCW